MDASFFIDLDDLSAKVKCLQQYCVEVQKGFKLGSLDLRSRQLVGCSYLRRLQSQVEFKQR